MMSGNFALVPDPPTNRLLDTIGDGVEPLHRRHVEVVAETKSAARISVSPTYDFMRHTYVLVLATFTSKKAFTEKT